MKISQKNGVGSGSGAGSGSGRRTFTYYKQQVKMGGLSATLYEMLALEKIGEKTTFGEYKFWVGADGTFSRKENSTGTIGPREELTRIESTYTYPKELKLEAPIK